ncbi:serine hydrolase [Acetivibrio cellulolyticus]|uniref:serine hydrolase n=1 Tax=Acetivibrio cellulolyticus TaxID=35830 RepID=UPI0001E3017A|nr:serine hydrolase [Acetivibrio cellulolyticus]
MLRKVSSILIVCLMVFSVSVNAFASGMDDKGNRNTKNYVSDSRRLENNAKIDAERKLADLRCKKHISKDDLEIKRNLEEYLNACADYRNFHGSVLVKKDGRVILANGYGMADYENNIPNMPNTRFAIASMTKQFTAMAILQLYENGKLNLDDKLSKYITDFARGEEITIHQLLTHTSGITNYTMLPEFWTMDKKDLNLDSIISMIKDKPLDFNPGESWNYSNSGYVLLGYIVENITGNSLEKYMEKNIFKPLKMKDTGVCYKNDKKMIKTVAYDGFLDIVPIDDSFALNGLFGAGYLYSTVEDINRWDKALNSDKLVSKNTMDLIFTPHVEIAPDNYYGYGWVIVGDGADKEIYHDGSVPGFSSIISRFVDRDTSIIILSNNSTAGSGIYDIKNDLNSILLGQDVELPVEKKSITLDTEILDGLTGTYEVAPGINFTISREENHLYAQLTGQEKYEIFAKSETQFFYRIVDAEISFTRDENGQVIGLVLHQLGMEIPGQKITDSEAETVQPAA